jgi:hypothetical protein
MEAVAVALIVAGVGVFGQWLLRRQDFARQDQVAAQAAEAARLLLERQDAVAAQAAEAAELLLDANERVAKQSEDAAKVTNGKLNQIHELVNSTLTAAIEDLRLATEQQLMLLRSVIELNREAGREPSPDLLAALPAVEEKVAELRSKLADRARQTEIADAQVSEAKR